MAVYIGIEGSSHIPGEEKASWCNFSGHPFTYNGKFLVKLESTCRANAELADSLGTLRF